MAAKIHVGDKVKHSVLERSVGQFFFDRAERHGNRTCQIEADTDKIETFKSLKLRATRVALSLQARGITSKDYIFCCASNRLDSAIPTVASTFLGAKVGNLDPSLSVRDVKHLLGLVEPSVVFAEDSSVELIELSLEGAILRPELVVLGRSSEYSTLDDFMEPKENEAAFRPVDVDTNDTAYMFFSSGSTGPPKAICMSHIGFLGIAYSILETGYNAETVLHLTTLYWISSVFAFMSTFLTGGRKVLVAKCDAEHIFRIIGKYKVTLAMFATSISYKLTNCPSNRKYNLSSLQVAMFGGTSMNPDQLKRTQELFEPALVFTAYAMSECFWITSFYPHIDEKLIKTKLRSSGRVSPGVTLKIVHPDTGELLEPYQKGELRLKTDTIMKGYLKQDCSSEFDEEGFFKTGDMGYYDEDDCFVIEDRLKEMFKYQSWHIIPSSLEYVLLEHPQVKDAAVYGSPNEEDGHRPAAAVVLVDGAKVGKEEIERFFAERVLDREKLRGGITFVKELPKTPSGKLMRSKLRDLFARK